MINIEKFFGKKASKISKPVKQKFNIYAKYENKMNPKEFKKLGDMLFTRKLKGSPQSLAQGLSINTDDFVKGRYGDRFKFKPTSSLESVNLKQTSG
jgi:hypothetical protein